MKNTFWLLLISGFLALQSCKKQLNAQVSEQETWKLGWRMIESTWDENMAIAELQFDSLLHITDSPEYKFLITGLEIKSTLTKNEEIINLFHQQDDETKRKICEKGIIPNFDPCKGLSEEKVENEDLQVELLLMYVSDQAARDNIMEDIISKYSLDKDKILNDGGVIVDERNRNRLKEIFSEFGFPNKTMVGKDAMYGIFLMIQHSDGDKNWQKSQLANIQRAVKKGDMSGQSYAYLYDRIKINGGEKQLYGSQFSNVDPVKKTVRLAETENIDNLDNRRREMGMMPIAMYKRMMLKGF